ncbi:HPr family phosphocarrier protein [Pirellulaceae bacterium SH501]
MSSAIQHCVVVVKNPEGLHMRPADKLVRTAASFQCQIELERAGQVADCRSILSLLTLAATQGSELILRAQGPDADQAVQVISHLFESQFDEPSAASS